VIALQINCFNVLSDTTAKTEVSLREQVENAISCSPCLVVLRHADALSHAVTTLDGKEGLPSSFVLVLCIQYLHSFQGHLFFKHYSNVLMMQARLRDSSVFFLE